MSIAEPDALDLDSTASGRAGNELEWVQNEHPWRETKSIEESLSKGGGNFSLTTVTNRFPEDSSLNHWGERESATSRIDTITQEDEEDDVDPDSCLPTHEGPTYVMYEKLKEINAALEQEPQPDKNRQRIIVFSEKVTRVMLSPDNSDAESLLHSDRDPPYEGADNVTYSANGSAYATEVASESEGTEQYASSGDHAIEHRDLSNALHAAPGKHQSSGDSMVSAAGSPAVATGSGFDGGQPRSSARATVPDEDEKVLVEMEGKFELISMKELQSLGYALPTKDDWDGSMMSGDASPHGSETSSSSGDSSSKSAQSDSAATSKSAANGSEPRPPPFPRPSTALARLSLGSASADRSLQTMRSSQRSRSAVTAAVATLPLHWGESGYRSPYGLTAEQREMKARREQMLQETQLTLQQRKKEEEKRKREENEDAFQAWLRKKKEEEAARPKSKGGDGGQQPKVGGEGGTTDTAAEREAAFRHWVRHKRAQHEEERLLQRRKEKEEAEGFLLRTREECERAFREWLHRKEKEMRRQKQESVTKARLRRSGSTRMSRKAMKLSKAIRDAKSFRYVDYYGYRF